MITKNYSINNVLAWFVITVVIALMAGAIYGTRWVTILESERNVFEEKLEVCQTDKGQAVIDKLYLENEVLRTKTSEL